jgi:hypothetical protein
MSRPWRYSLATILLGITLVAVAMAGWLKAERLRAERDDLASLVQSQPKSPHEAYLRSQPLTVVLSTQSTGIDGSWCASVDFGGDGRVRFGSGAISQQAQFTATEPQLTQLREALIAEHFFDLPSDVGELVPDGGSSAMTIVVGQQSKTVRLLFLGNMANRPNDYSLPEREQAARALRIWLIASDPVAEPRVATGRQYAMKTLAKLDAANGQPTVPPEIPTGRPASDARVN